MSSCANVGDSDPADSKLSPEALARLVAMVEDKAVTADAPSR